MVEQIMNWAEQNYQDGGHWIVERMTEEEVGSRFDSLAEAQNFCRESQEHQDQIDAAMRYWSRGSYGVYDKEVV